MTRDPNLAILLTKSWHVHQRISLTRMYLQNKNKTKKLCQTGSNFKSCSCETLKNMFSVEILILGHPIPSYSRLFSKNLYEFFDFASWSFVWKPSWGYGGMWWHKIKISTKHLVFEEISTKTSFQKNKSKDFLSRTIEVVTKFGKVCFYYFYTTLYVTRVKSSVLIKILTFQYTGENHDNFADI